MKQWTLPLLTLNFLLFASLGAAQPTTEEPLPVLEFHTYALEWVRFKNVAEDGTPLLHSEDATSFPFIRVVSPGPVRRNSPGNPGSVEELLLGREIAWEASLIAGDCDTKRLAGKSSDVLCVPGTSGMPGGYIFLALFHPETQALVALTTSIDNRGGVAVRASQRAINPPAPETEAPAPETEAPAPEPSADGCGPYAPGQWIKLHEYKESGLELPVNMDDVGHPDHITDYQCIVQDDGSAYLKAYHIIAQSARTQTVGSGESLIYEFK